MIKKERTSTGGTITSQMINESLYIPPNFGSLTTIVNFRDTTPKFLERSSSTDTLNSDKCNLPDIFSTCPSLRRQYDFIKQTEIISSPSAFVYDKANTVPRFSYPRQIRRNEDPPDNAALKFDIHSHIINPRELKFIPHSEWSNQIYSLSDLHQIFFRKRNGLGRMFPIKLYNALLITKKYPESFKYIGVKWVGKDLILVNSKTFAALLGIRSVQGGLFHKQGNFSRHNFLQVMRTSIKDSALISLCREVDDFNVRLYTDMHNRFNRDKPFEFAIAG